MPPDERRNSLADAFGIDADDLRRVEEGVGPSTSRVPRSAPDEPTEISPGIVRMGAHEYIVMDDGRLEPATNQVQMNFTVTAKERHLLKQLAYDERRSLVSYLREVLESRGLV